MRRDVPRISDAEWDILNVLWKKAPLTTVRTFLTRLVDKGAVRAGEPAATPRRFVPAVSREECVRQESDSFLARVFEGGTAALLLHFARSKRLHPEELAELEAILTQKRKERP